jgi:MarR family multiple antibiotic resistance transcriptional regulator
MIQRKQLVQDLMEQFATIRRLTVTKGHGDNDLLSRHDLTRPQVMVLMILDQRLGLTVGKVAELMGVSGGAATQMLDIMVRRDLIGRSPDPDDRRVIRLDLTAAGRTLAQEVAKSMAERMTRMTHDLSDEELQQLTTIMGKLNAAMEREVSKEQG